MTPRWAVGAGWLALALVGGGCAVANFVTGAPPAGSTPAAPRLLARRCSGCHATPNPATMSATQWHAALERMKLRMKLPANEWDSLAAMGPSDGRP